MLAVEDEGDSAALTAASRDHGLLHNTAGGGRVLRFLPALTLSDADVDEGLGRLESALVKMS